MTRVSAAQGTNYLAESMIDVSNKLRILYYIREYRTFYGYQPTYREIAAGLELALGTVCGHVAIMKRMGILTGSQTWRSLREVERSA